MSKGGCECPEDEVWNSPKLLLSLSIECCCSANFGAEEEDDAEEEDVDEETAVDESESESLVEELDDAIMKKIAKKGGRFI